MGAMNVDRPRVVEKVATEQVLGGSAPPGAKAAY
jgi:hypothetical protein